MLLIPCPWCGPRDEIEFMACGPLAPRPDPDSADDAAWTAYLFQTGNERGWSREYWSHAYGCGQVFAIRRHTLTHAIAIDGEGET